MPAPRPGVVPLRPLGVGEVLDGAFQTIRTHPRLVLGVAAVLAVVSVLVQVPLTYAFGSTFEGLTDPTSPPDLAVLGQAMAGLSVVAVIGLVVGVLVNSVLTGLLMVVVGRSVLGAPVDARESAAAIRPRLPALLGVVVLSLVITVVVFVVCLLPAVLVGAVTGSVGAGIALAVLGVLVGVLAALVATVLLLLAPAACVLEGLGVVASLRRSLDLVRSRFWPVTGTFLLAVLITYAVGLVLGLLFGALGAGAGGLAGTTGAYDLVPLLVQGVGTVIATTLTAPFQAAVGGLLYVDQRMRREGFDIELRRAAGR